MLLRSAAAIVALAHLAFASQVGALALLADDRYEEGSYRNGPDPNTGEPDTIHEWRDEPPFFGAYEGRPDSAITLSPDGLGLDGRAQGESWGSFYCDLYCQFSIGVASFSIAFRIDGEGSLQMDGSLTGNPLYQFDPWVTVFSGTQTIYHTAFAEIYGLPIVSFAADLPPGEYRIEAYTGQRQDDVSGEFDFTFHVRDSVPEPATVLMLGAALAWLGTRRVGTR